MRRRLTVSYVLLLVLVLAALEVPLAVTHRRAGHRAAGRRPARRRDPVRHARRAGAARRPRSRRCARS